MTALAKIGSLLLVLFLTGAVPRNAAASASGEDPLFPHTAEEVSSKEAASGSVSAQENAADGASAENVSPGAASSDGVSADDLPDASPDGGAPAGPGTGVTPGNLLPDGSFACGSAEELLRLVNEERAERITLTADLEWTFPCPPDEPSPSLAPAAPTVVMMNGHTLRIAAGCRLAVWGPLRLEGDSAGRPLVTVEGEFKGGEVEISAYGEGSTALHVKADASWTGDWMELTAEGTGATALRLETNQSTSLTCFSAAAYGEGAVGIRADGPLELFACSIVADGEAIVCGGELLLDGCHALPAPKDAKLIRRRAVPADRIEQIGYSALVGTPREEIEDWFALGEDGFQDAYYEFYDLDNKASTRTLSIRVTREGIPADCSAAGTHTVTTRPLSLPAWFPLEIPAYTAPFHVVPPGTPWIKTVWLMGEPGLHFVFLTPIEGADRIELEYSLDKGKTWIDARTLPRCDIYGSSADLAGLEIDRTYCFRLTVIGGSMAGVSNVLEFPYTTGDPTQIGGGDRDDGDRGEQNELPPGPVVPPPAGPQYPTEPGPEPGSVPDSQTSGESSALLPPESQPETSPRPESVGSAPAPGEPAPPPEANLFLTASELAAQRKANPEGVTFIGEGIRATLPGALLELLPADESLALHLERIGEEGFVLRLWAGKREWTDFGGHSVWVTVEYPISGGAAYICTGPDGVITEAEAQNGRLRVELNAAGSYRLSAAPPSARSEPPVSSAAAESHAQTAAGPSVGLPPSGPDGSAPGWAAAILAAAGLALSGTVFFLRRKKGGSR